MVPYSWLSNQDVLQQVISGDLRPIRPDICPQDLWERINACFLQDPLQRPTFLQLESSITEFIEKNEETETSPATSIAYGTVEYENKNTSYSPV